MSAQTCDVTKIHDEDTLRRMWQDSDDFGRKKEIRAHMYKMREAKLKEFYSSGEVSRDIQRTNSSPSMREQTKGGTNTHHADSLADHSFLSLKSKEIRDSESPTRELSYKINDKLASDQGWTIKTTDERSPDGKKHTTSRLATTAGSEKIQGGTANYAAKNAQTASIYKDGDDQNYTKSAAATTESHLRQEAQGGDANSKFYSSSTSSKSSSKIVSEHKSSDVDLQPTQNIVKTYTSNVPEELKKHPNYVDGTTKVFTETKTLPDGSQVTTTRYETTGAKTTQSSNYSSSSKHQSSSEQRQSSTHSTNEARKTIKDSQNKDETQSSTHFTNEARKTIRDSQNKDEVHFTNEARRTIKDSQNMDEVDNVRVIKYSHPDFDVHTTRSGHEEIRSSTQRGEQKNEQKFSSSNITRDSRQLLEENRRKDVGVQNQNVREEIIISKQPKNVEHHTTTVTKTIVVDDAKKFDNNKVSDDFINVERQFVRSTSPAKRPVQEVAPKSSPISEAPKYEQPERRQPIQPPKSEMETNKHPTEGQYDTTYRSEFTNKRISVDINPTHDAFVRSLRSVTPERINSRSSPTRGSNKNLKTSTTSLRTSQSPEKNRLVGRYSPDRTTPTKRQPTTYETTRTTMRTEHAPRKAKSPDKYSETITRRTRGRAPESPTRKSPEKYSETTTRTTTTTTSKRYSPDRNQPRKSPESYSTIRRNTHNTDINTKNQYNSDTTTNHYSTDTISRRNKKITSEEIDSTTLTRRNKIKPRSRSSSPTDTVSDFEYHTNTNEIITDLDAEDNIIITLSKDANHILNAKRTITRKTEDVERRPTTLNYASPTKELPSPKQVPRRSSLKATRPEPTSPSETPPQFFTVSPNEEYKGYVPKEKPARNKSKPFKRSDTYEERCRQILGIPEKKKTEKSISDILFNDRNRSKSPDKKSPTKDVPRKASLPDEARRPSRKFSDEPYINPEKRPFEPYPEKSALKKEAPKINEFPSQIRKSPERRPKQQYPEKKSPSKEAPKIQEFPSQIRRSPERQSRPEYSPERQSPDRDAPKIQEFPSQIRRSPEKESRPEYSTDRDAPKLQEFPSQIRKSPERVPLENYPEKYVPLKEAPLINEFPAQIRKSPEREALQNYPEKFVPRSTKDEPIIHEFQSPRKTPERNSPSSESPIQEFPSQIRRSPERQLLEKYPEKATTISEAPKIGEFPSQIRRSPERQPLEKYPEKASPVKETPKIEEFPSQIRRESPEREPKIESPKKVQPLSETPEFISKKPKSPAKTSVEDKLIEQTTKYIEGKRVPVDEPLFTKKFMYELGSDEEDEVITTTKKTTTETTSRKSPMRQFPDASTEKPVKGVDAIKSNKIAKIDTIVTTRPESPRRSPERLSPVRGIPDVEDTITHKTVKKDFSRREEVNNAFIHNERIDIEVNEKEKPRSRSPVKRPGITDDLEENITTTVTTSKFTKVTKKPTTEVSQPKAKPGDKSSTLVKKPSIIKQLPASTKPDRSTPERRAKPEEKKPALAQKTPSVREFPSQKRPNRIASPDGKACCRKEVVQTTTDVKVTKKIEQPKRKIVSTTISLTPKNSSGNLLQKTPTKTTPKTPITTTKVFPINERSSPARRTPQRTIDEPKTIVRITSTPKIAPVKQLSSKKLTTTATTTKTVKVATKLQAKPFQNGQPDSEDEDTKVIRTEQIKTKVTTRVGSRPEIKPTNARTDKPKKLEKKCLSTKSIIIHSTISDQREIIVDLQRSKSSREGTPDRVYPLPLTEEDSGIPRYPDQILEPEEPTRRPSKRIIDVPLTESEDVSDFSRFTDVSELHNVMDTDECLLSVNEKVSKFLKTADKLTSKKPKNVGPAPKVDRPTLIIDENIQSDECLLSVSDKVSKFITTAEKLTINEIPDRPKSPRCQNIIDIDLDDESLLSVSEKVTHFVNTTDEKTTKLKGVAPKVQRPDLTNVDETLKTDECLLSVSDKVTKFVTTAEKLTKNEKAKAKQTDFITLESEALVQENEPTKRAKSPPKKVTLNDKAPFKIDKQAREKSPPKQPECATIITDDDMYKTPKRTPDLTQTTRRVEETVTRRDSAKIEPDATPKSSKRPEPETKTFLGSVGRLRSTESVRKAKAMFESIEKEQRPKQRDILSRPSVFEARKTIKKDDVKLTDIGVKRTVDRKDLNEVRKKLTYEEEIKLHSTRRSSSPKSIPEIVEPEHHLSPEDVPHYMRQLDRSLREKSPHLEDVLKLEQITTKTVHVQPSEEDLKITKFGVVLKRADSEKFAERRRSSATITADINGVKKELEIEEIWDLHILEIMLEKVTQYELRRRIRAQIRIVKKQISDNKLQQITTTTVTRKVTKAPSPIKQIPKNTQRDKSPEKQQKPRGASPDKYPTTPRDRHTPDRSYKSERHTSEYQTKYTKRNSFDSNKPVDNKLFRHTDLLTNKDTSEKITEYQTSYSRRSSDISTSRKSSLRDSPSRKSSLRDSPVRSSPSRDSPGSRDSPTRNGQSPGVRGDFKPFRRSPDRTKTDTKRTNLITKSTEDDKPSWVTQRTLKKVTERAAPVGSKKITTTTTTVTKKSNLRSSPPKDLKPTDVITSSYGVGPTDEYGSPLFGLRALRAQNKNEKTKGTVMHSQFYSENGNEPIGEISVTKYSSDPKDLGSTEDLTHKDGLLSKTTTQKFGYKDTPSYRNMTDKKVVCDRDNETRTSSTSTTSKITRRGSVKEMSQKFLDNAVDTLKSERQSTSYPKAGLILRTSSFKDSNSDDSREGSPTGTREMHKTVTVRSSTSTSGGKGETFLTNTSRVSGVQDVISRMKSEDYREGESAEDTEARSLLNKFIGSQVILSGMEGHAGRPNSIKTGGSLNTTSSSSTSSSTRRSTKVTSTITENGTPKSTTRTFTHPITQDILDTIWDEYTLRLLLENSQEYEERRIIRLRLKQVMAEKEACSELVEKTLEETQSGNIQEKVETTKQTFSDGPMTKTQVTTRVTSQQITKKPISPFAKFHQLDKQNSLNTPPSTPKTPTSGGPMFKFTDPNLSRSAATIKERLLQWCQMKTKEYENIQLDNFSTSWADGLAFCALIHHFMPDAFDYSKLTPKNRRYNFTLAFQTADEKADIAPLLDVDDMVTCRKPDWKCVFTYVQSIYRHYKDTD